MIFLLHRAKGTSITRISGNPLLSFSNAISQIRKKRAIVILDDASTRISGYIVTQAANISADLVSLLINHARAVICVAMDQERLDKFELTPMTADQSSSIVDMMVSVEAREGVTTGISAADRAQTLRMLASADPTKRDIVSPGHIFPLRVQQGGVLQRSAIAEAAYDLLKLAGVEPVAALCQILDDTGEIASAAAIEQLAQSLDLPVISISEIIRQRLLQHSIIEKIAEAELPTTFAGSFRAHCFISATDGAEHIALVKGEINLCEPSGEQVPLLVRVQAENKIGDLFGTKNLLQRKSIRKALLEINSTGRGAFVYIRHSKLGAVSSSIASLNTQAQAYQGKELRQHGIGAQILNSLGVKRIALLTNSSKDVSGVNAFGLEIVKHVALP